MYDVLINNAVIIDGTGRSRFKGSIGIIDGKIALADKSDFAKRVIDADGRFLTPGFVDAHSHGDLVLGKEFARLCKSSQGITTEIGGQCGSSMFPVRSERLELIKDILSLGTIDFPQEMVNWHSFADYVLYAEKQPKTANIKLLIGHNTLRVAAMGCDNRKPTSTELNEMKDILDEAMKNGAAGLSTGRVYTPGCYAELEELVELAKVIKPYRGIYASHMKNESYDIVNSVREVMKIGSRAGVSVFVSHHKVFGRDNWGFQRETLRMIEDAVMSGMRVTCDQYPYDSCMTHLLMCIPPWYYDKGIEAAAKLLEDPDVRAKIRTEMQDPGSRYDNYYLNAGGWDGIITVSAAFIPDAEGKTISEYAAANRFDPFDAFFDIIMKNNGLARAVFKCMCEDDIFEIAKAPNTVIGTDGLVRAFDEKGHPRAYAAFPKAINYFVKENGIMTLEEMIKKMTSLPAERFNLGTKGIVAEGYDADLLLIDYDKLRDNATYIEPSLLCDGIDYVIVGGEIVYKEKKLTGATPGKVLRH